MEQYKYRREMDNKRVADVFKGKAWNPSEQHHIEIKRHEENPHSPSIGPKPPSIRPKPKSPDNEVYTKHRKPNVYEKPHDPDMEGGPKVPRKPKSPDNEAYTKRPKPNGYEKPNDPDMGGGSKFPARKPKPKYPGGALAVAKEKELSK